MKEIIETKIKNLDDILKKYKKLNKETNNKYLYREFDIINEIELLEEVLRMGTDVEAWEKCYREDREEVEKPTKTPLTR
ncbi:MAG TPA: hypothetical protein VK071_10390 [Tissierellales bacterium]|nr:hypothetical protein [Tissierellales bacterium]